MIARFDHPCFCTICQPVHSRFEKARKAIALPTTFPLSCARVRVCARTYMLKLAHIKKDVRTQDFRSENLFLEIITFLRQKL